MGESHLVVDGSNIATEGRSLPSLEQLLDAVEAVSKEFSYDNVTVIVDATFGHRIDASERPAYEDKTNNGEIITPPAGVIGRGDAFILEVADRADAVVLSNDSFQEFHGTYDWLFEEGRLIGGKHVPGVGWIFLARSPVRGPTSRRAVSDAKRKRRGSKKTAKAKPSSKRPSSKSAKSSRSSKKASSKKSSSSSSDNEKKDTGRKRGGKEPEPYNEPLPFIEFVGAHPVGSVIQAEVEQFSSHGAYVVCDGTRCYISLKSISDPPPRSAREVLTIGETRDFVVQAVDTPRRGIDLAMPGMESIDAEDLPEETEAAPEPEPATTKGRTRTRAPEREPEPAGEPEPAPKAEPAGEAEAEPVDEKKLSVSQRRKLRARQQAEAAAAEEAVAAPAKKAPTKKAASRKTSTRKKAAAKKTSTRKKATAKKTAATKKTATRKTTAKKTAAKKRAAKKTSTRKTSTRRKAAAKKTSTRASSTTEKAATKKSAARKSTARKAAAKKTATRQDGGHEEDGGQEAHDPEVRTAEAVGLRRRRRLISLARPVVVRARPAAWRSGRSPPTRTGREPRRTTGCRRAGSRW